jgi:hydrogenase-4 component B
MILYGLAILLVAVSGLPGLGRGRRAAAWAAALMGLGALIGLVPALAVLHGWMRPFSHAFLHPPQGTPGLLALDPLGALFLMPVLVLPALGALYGVGYWNDPHHGRRLRALLGLTTACMGLLVAASHAITFLLAWEGMAAAAFFLVITEDQEAETRKAAWIYLAATHSGTLCLFGAFALLASATGSFALGPLPAGFAASPRGAAAALLFLAGFGLKAGLMPLHFWLPGAHAAAPSHVSSFMSGIFIKMGILGLVRILALVPDPPLLWGEALTVLGAVSCVLGVACALGQHDLKRLLAYHSIENIGIILLGLGLGTLGRCLGSPVMAFLGYGGALFHVINHSLFKGLLFLGAGSAVRATGTRNLEAMGGLARAMPWTAGTFLTGSWAICGLPPLNGFVSEFLIYMAAFRGLSLGHSAYAALALTALALAGALAAACFAKVFGMAFLGTPRSPEAARAVESPSAMRAPMAILAGACALLGLFPILLGPALGRAAAQLAGTPPLPFHRLAHLALFTWIALPLLGAGALLWAWTRRRIPSGLPTWDCGYAVGLPRAQYTSSSFAEGLVSWMAVVLRPKIHWRRVTGTFPSPRRYESHVPDAVLDRLVEPGLGLAARGAAFLRFLQGGHLALYLLYILLTLLAIFWMVA